ncbi:putative RNA-directed DNA polymerase [Magnetospirillum gryphiswaldense MSR-1 v2]|uniref:RNA-directed DNA polymerase n=1 Tax=Magnetospirillum gryphiswaldense (strain DSM 6361 / JCM 21280 / NBRC 15271 / MSR-1) TaxID=431944 RepID=V6F750_MAGGM|nr:retron St85 family RNA-directed DNA polymerase [Magnetospirillum gryphiswaldense]CDL01340.1 putative RNA-directed DNA polymerase [Magnetospirillum gryphiswaldense MSR-1 v2]
MTTAALSLELRELSSELGFAPQHVFYLVKCADELYFDIEIPKRTPGEFRKISVPRTELKGVQRAILRKILSSHEPSEFAHSYIKGKSVISAAKKLLGEKAVLKVDLKNFFPAISARRVFGLFRALGFSNKKAFILTKLTTYKGTLCQGAPTSPAISNLVCRSLDKNINALAISWKLNYLRYCDDIYLYHRINFNSDKLLTRLRRTVNDHGFSLNEDKTRYYAAGNPRITLGLSTHGRVLRLPRAMRREHRAAFHKASTSPTWAEANLSKLRGMAEWHKAVYGSDATYKHYREIIKNVPLMKVHEPFAI